jgi:hypothetical protein
MNAFFCFFENAKKYQILKISLKKREFLLNIFKFLWFCCILKLSLYICTNKSQNKKQIQFKESIELQ